MESKTMLWLLALGLLLVSSLDLCVSQEQDLSKLEWWKKTNLYHIYIRSFKDTNGDGQGDLRGVTSKLDYLQSIGVETLLLSPFYSSPMVDGGYDIDDYTSINPLFGTMADWDELVVECKKRGLHIVVDMVPNHSSDNHPWFKCSERALIDPENCGKYKDYYVWSSSTKFHGKPTNWVSYFEATDPGSIWTWSPVRKEFYLHQFTAQQPDLNLRNPEVREEMKEVVRFWLRKGADGLRVDAVLFMMEDTIEFRNNPSEPKSFDENLHPYDRLYHNYTKSMPESARICKDWYDVTREPEFIDRDPVVIVEAYDDIPVLLEYYGESPENRYSDAPFTMHIMANLNKNTQTPQDYENAVNAWASATSGLNWPAEGGAKSPWSIWVLGNHDTKRTVERVGDAQADALSFLAFLAPGSPVFYYGDEIGMKNSPEEEIPQRTLDEGEPTRLPFRAPMAWSPAEPAGDFSTTRDTWLPLNSDFKKNNVETQLSESGKNHLKNFIALQKLRKEHLETIMFGDLVYFDRSENAPHLFAMARTHPRFGSLLLVVNLSNESEQPLELLPKPDAGLLAPRPPQKGRVLLMNREWSAPDRSGYRKLQEGDEVMLESITLAPNQALIFGYENPLAIAWDQACAKFGQCHKQ